MPYSVLVFSLHMSDWDQVIAFAKSLHGNIPEVMTGVASVSGIVKAAVNKYKD